MPTDQPTKPRPRKPTLTKAREFAKTAIATNLWLADQRLFDEVAGRRKTTNADLLREIVHEWAIVKRLSEQSSDNLELAAPLRRLHQQIISKELEPVTSTLASIVSLLTDQNPAALPQKSNSALAPPDNQDSAFLTVLQRLTEELKTTKQELEKLKAFAIAHYILAGQSFAATWAVLDFIQRFIAEPILKDQGTHDDPFQATIVHRDDARGEGLQIVEQMALQFNYPAEFPMTLFYPPDMDL